MKNIIIHFSNVSAVKRRLGENPKQQRLVPHVQMVESIGLLTEVAYSCNRAPQSQRQVDLCGFQQGYRVNSRPARTKVLCLALIFRKKMGLTVAETRGLPGECGHR